MPTIKSSTDLRNNYNAISTLCHESRKPVFITRNGQSDLAVMSIDVYEEMMAGFGERFEDPKEELYRLLAEGRKDVEEGRTHSHEEVFERLRQRIHNGAI